MSWFLENMATSLIALGLVLLIIEILVLGFATFALFFLGVSCVITGIAMSLGALDAHWQTALWSNAVVTAILAAGLWQPLKRMQEQKQQTPVNSDFATIEFTLEEDVNNLGGWQYQYSGITWTVKSQSPLTKGTKVKVVNKEVGTLWVEPTE